MQAPTTDVPVSQVTAIRSWFDGVLREKLFPMLAARYPYAIGSPDELRVMDEMFDAATVGPVVANRADSSRCGTARTAMAMRLINMMSSVELCSRRGLARL